MVWFSLRVREVASSILATPPLLFLFPGPLFNNHAGSWRPIKYITYSAQRTDPLALIKIQTNIQSSPTFLPLKFLGFCRISLSLSLSLCNSLSQSLQHEQIGPASGSQEVNLSISLSHLQFVLGFLFQFHCFYNLDSNFFFVVLSDTWTRSSRVRFFLLSMNSLPCISFFFFFFFF